MSSEGKRQALLHRARIELGAAATASRQRREKSSPLLSRCAKSAADSVHPPVRTRSRPNESHTRNRRAASSSRRAGKIRPAHRRATPGRRPPVARAEAPRPAPPVCRDEKNQRWHSCSRCARACLQFSEQPGIDIEAGRHPVVRAHHGIQFYRASHSGLHHLLPCCCFPSMTTADEVAVWRSGNHFRSCNATSA